MSIFRCTPTIARRWPSIRFPTLGLSRAKLLLDRGDGAACVPASASRKRRPRWLPQFHQWVASTATNDKERANLPALVITARRGRAGHSAPPVLEAAVRAVDAGGIDPGHRLRQCRQSAAGARRGENAGNGATAERGRGPVSRGAATAYRKRSAGVDGWRPGSIVRHLGDSLSYAAAGQRRGELHAARRIELARAGGGGGAVHSHGRAVRPGSGASIHARGCDAGAEGNAGGATGGAALVPARQPEPRAGGGADRASRC